MLLIFRKKLWLHDSKKIVIIGGHLVLRDCNLLNRIGLNRVELDTTHFLESNTLLN